MPKAARRQSGPRAEPYPAIKPGDKPHSPIPKSATSKNTISKKAALAAKSSASINASSDSSNKRSTHEPTSSFLDIKLDGEDEGYVKVYDTCSVIRQKINALLGKDNAKPENGVPGQFKKDGTPKPYTKAEFLRAITFGKGDPPAAATLDRFLKAKKLMGGGGSPVYPGAYKFFEKKRIFEGKKKTPTRIQCEEEYVSPLSHLLTQSALSASDFDPTHPSHLIVEELPLTQVD